MAKGFRDPRNDIVQVFDLNGAPHQFTLTNAREMVRNAGWTIDPKEAGKRRGAPAAAPEVDDEQNIALKNPVPLKPTVILEDLTSLTKITLRRACAYLNIEFDGRAKEKGLVALLDTELDSRLSAADDLDGAEQVDPTDMPDVIAQKQADIAARRRRAYVSAAKAAGIEVTDTASLNDIVAKLADLAPEDPSEKKV